jgi:hypothetical protein
MISNATHVRTYSHLATPDPTKGCRTVRARNDQTSSTSPAPREEAFVCIPLFLTCQWQAYWQLTPDTAHLERLHCGDAVPRSPRRLLGGRAAVVEEGVQQVDMWRPPHECFVFDPPYLLLGLPAAPRRYQAHSAAVRERCCVHAAATPDAARVSARCNDAG